MDKIQFPPIEIKFGKSEELNEEILSVYIRTVTDAINAARGNVAALKKIRAFAKEVAWTADSLIFEAENPHGERKI